MESILSLVSEVKEKMLSLEHASAYDTAWVAMIPSPRNGPMFEGSLDWIVENQKEGGFWGETNKNGDELLSIGTLPATLACLLALKTWNNGAEGHKYQNNIDRGLKFIHSEAEINLKNKNLPNWFVLTFPAMIELATAAGLNLVFPPGSKHIIASIFSERNRILEMEESIDLQLDDPCCCFPPLVSNMEALLPSTYPSEDANQYLSRDGSLFQSPSATAQAFMLTGNLHYINYLKSLMQEFPSGGVPSKYDLDGEIIKLCMVDHLQGLGLAEHFDQYIEHTLSQVYRSFIKDNTKAKSTETNIVQQLFKDALAFRLLRVQGYNVNPGSFCWFLHEPKTLSCMKQNPEELFSAMYNVYRATCYQFPGESELDEARVHALRVLKTIGEIDHISLISKGLENMIQYELSVPWIARLDHLYHRKWIEENKTIPLWIGKASSHRLSYLNNKLMQLAEENFAFRQSIYRQELEELKGWSHKWRLSEMGFGREKTVYSYFVAAASCCLPYDSIMRLVIAKAAIIVTVADDFYDMEGSLTDLEILTEAVMRWDSRDLQGHSKTIFDALDDFVNDIAENCCLPGERINLVTKLQHLWRETFASWMVERRWSLTGYLPSMDEYLETGMTSIAAHTIALPATDFTSQNGTQPEYHNITKLLMALARLVNDTQSYHKEQEDGKINLVLLHSIENQNGTIEDSIEYVKNILEAKRREFLEHVFMDGDMKKPCKQIHLSCMKVFQMLYNSGNLFDSEVALADEIMRALYIPITQKPKVEPFSKPISLISPKKKKTPETTKIVLGFRPIIKDSYGIRSFIKQPSIKILSSYADRKKMNVPIQLGLGYV